MVLSSGKLKARAALHAALASSNINTNYNLAFSLSHFFLLFGLHCPPESPAKGTKTNSDAKYHIKLPHIYFLLFR